MRERTVDFAGRLEDGRIVLVEIQGSYDKTLPLRLIDVFVRAYERYQSFPLQVILWISERRGDFLAKLAFLVRLRKDLKLEYKRWFKEVSFKPIAIDFERDPFYKKGLIVGKKEGLKIGI